MKKYILTLIILVTSLGITYSQTQSELNANSSSEFVQINTEMNMLIIKIAGVLSESEVKALLASQKAWITYRDLECKLESMGNKGGSMYSMVFASCMTNMTRKRIIELNEILKAER